ncbi:hypothetical protein [Pseudomonas donghuensis]|uniref:hypothetical protein n=1 Tax=Pseudomonas donghuensis TaxID=1163398 RepID=UPI0002DD8DC3|nr:hypothetical protein [Pseudomonas donghuensis]
MAINIVDVEEVLRQQPHPLTLMSLEALNPAREPYRAILLQPSGMVEANDVRVGHADAAVGHALCRGFLSAAAKSHSDLAVAPEYCVPWSVVEEIVAGDYRPPQGAIWVLGCESISPVDFQSLAQQYNAAGECVFHHEPLDARQAAQRRYLDPLLYIFWAQNQDGQPVLCLLAQLKTVACRDYRDVEQTSLCLGKTVYAFNRGINSMSLVSIICSDAFDFTEHIDEIHTNCLLIHIQLNPKPAHTDYAAYRTRLCSVGTNSHVELLCLNWARNIKEVKSGGKYADWNNVAGSAWYAPPIKFSADDGIIDSLHRKGLYYCLLAQRWHSFFLNYEGQIIQLQKQKLLFPGEQALAPKNFVAVEERWSWREDNYSWQSGAVADDGFSGALAEYQAIAQHLRQASLESPLAVERAIEILMGPRGTPATWYTVKELDAVHLDKDEESIRRVTVHQDADLTRPGSSYRLQRLQRAHDAIGLAHNDVPWPPSVRDLADGFKFSWKRNSPHHNVETNAGVRGPATLVYLSDQANNLAVEAMHQKLRTAITNQVINEACAAGKSAEELSDIIVRAQDRLCVVFRRNNRFGARGPEGMNLIDVPASASPVDFSEDRS